MPDNIHIEGAEAWHPDIWPQLLILVPTVGRPDLHTSRWLRRQERIDDHARLTTMKAQHDAGEPMNPDLQWPQIRYFEVEHELPGYVEDVRQAMTDFFLSTGCEWLMMLDDDTTPQRDAHVILSGAVEAGIKLVVCPTPYLSRRAGRRGVIANVYTASKDGEKVKWKAMRYHDLPWGQKERYLPIQSAGIGCMLIHRSVLGQLMSEADEGKAPYPWRAVWGDHAAPPGMRGRVIISEDLAFHGNCLMAGYKLYCDLSCPCEHAKMTRWTPNLAVDVLPFVEGKDAMPNPDAPYENAIPPDQIFRSAGVAPPEKRKGPEFVRG